MYAFNFDNFRRAFNACKKFYFSDNCPDEVDVVFVATTDTGERVEIAYGVDYLNNAAEDAWSELFNASSMIGSEASFDVLAAAERQDVRFKLFLESSLDGVVFEG